MNQTKYLLLALLILFAPALCTGGCSLDIGRDFPANQADDSGADAEAWNRLQPIYWTANDGSKFIAPWHFWANPASSWLPDYAESIYRPLRDADSATPHAWRPFYDAKLHSPCLFHKTDDGEVRCLPGWVQMEPDDARDGFYAEPTCADIRQWVYALPASETEGALTQRYLVTAQPRQYETPRVFGQIPHRGRVWWKHAADDKSETRRCEEVTGSDRLRFFGRGEEMALTEFVKLGAGDGAGPG